MNYIVYVPVKNVLNLYLKIKNLLNKSIWEYAILFKDASAIIVDKKTAHSVGFISFPWNNLKPSYMHFDFKVSSGRWSS